MKKTKEANKVPQSILDCWQACTDAGHDPEKFFNTVLNGLARKLKENPAGFEIVFRFDDDWPQVENTLMQDDLGEFHLAHTDRDEKLRRDKPRHVSILQAFEWFAKCEEFSNESFTGNLSPLIRAAVDRKALVDGIA